MDIFGAFVRTTYPTPSSQYLNARGAAYNSTAEVLASAADWQLYTGTGNSTVHLLGGSFGNAPISSQDACQAYESIGFSYQMVRLAAASVLTLCRSTPPWSDGSPRRRPAPLLTKCTRARLDGAHAASGSVRLGCYRRKFDADAGCVGHPHPNSSSCLRCF